MWVDKDGESVLRQPVFGVIIAETKKKKDFSFGYPIVLHYL